MKESVEAAMRKAGISPAMLEMMGIKITDTGLAVPAELLTLFGPEMASRMGGRGEMPGFMMRGKSFLGQPGEKISAEELKELLEVFTDLIKALLQGGSIKHTKEESTRPSGRKWSKTTTEIKFGESY